MHSHPQFIVLREKEKSSLTLVRKLFLGVELRGFEPLTSTMRM